MAAHESPDGMHAASRKLLRNYYKRERPAQNCGFQGTFPAFLHGLRTVMTLAARS